jgi:hypothetical protein
MPGGDPGVAEGEMPVVMVRVHQRVLPATTQTDINSFKLLQFPGRRLFSKVLKGIVSRD